MEQHTRTAMQKQLTNLDLTKFICALMVLTIHTAPLQQVSELAHFYVTDVLARFAVPLFFSISGFLFFRKLVWERGKIKNCRENRAKLFAYVKRIGLLYLGWSVVYILSRLPEWYQSGWWGTYVIKDVLVAFFVRGSHYHLWYLLASIYAAPVLYAMLTVMNRKHVGIAASILWVCECLTYSYRWLGTDQIGIITMISDKIPIAFDTLFRAVPLLAIGAMCVDRKPLKNERFQICVTVAAMLLCAAEASALFFLVSREGAYSYLFTTPFFAYAALRLLTGEIQVRISASWAFALRNSSLTIYCLHPLVRTILEAAGVSVGIPLWAATTILTTGAALLWAKIRLSTK